MQIVAKPSADMGGEASGKASVVLPPPLGMSSLIAAATAVPPVDHVCHKAEIRAKKESKRIKKENNTVYKKPAAKVVGVQPSGSASSSGTSDSGGGQGLSKMLKACASCCACVSGPRDQKGSLARSAQRNTVIFQIRNHLKKVAVQVLVHHFPSEAEARRAAEVLLILYNAGASKEDLEACKANGHLGSTLAPKRKVPS